MKNQFNITGYYYEINNYAFRKFLNIKKKNTKLQKPDIMVVMMNPGGSQPLNGNQDGQTETKAKPDRTQNQIMQVMLNRGYEYARILNLSDLREPISPIFNQKIQYLNKKNIPHSIFDKHRQVEFQSLWVTNVPVIFAWGVNKKLQPLALQAMAVCKVSNPIGILKPNTNWAFYHPFPPNATKQKQWVFNISQQL